MPDQKNPRHKDSGFPSLRWEEDFLPTRPIPLNERPLQARIDYEMATVAEHHVRIALAIEKFWGHKDFAEYIENLILSGYKEGEKRLGFKPEVVSALINLAQLHQFIR